MTYVTLPAFFIVCQDEMSIFEYIALLSESIHPEAIMPGFIKCCIYILCLVAEREFFGLFITLSS